MNIVYAHARKGNKTIVTIQIEGEEETRTLEYSANYFAQLLRSNISRDEIVFIDLIKLLREEGSPYFKIRNVSSSRLKIKIPKLKILIERGNSAKAIGVYFGVSSVTIHMYVKDEIPVYVDMLVKNSIKKRDQSPGMPSEFPKYKEQVISLIKQGCSRKEIVAIIGVSAATLGKWLHAFIPEYIEVIAEMKRSENDTK